MSCETRESAQLISSRPLWSDPRISVQAWRNPLSEDGTVLDPIRIAFCVDGSSWFLPWLKFIELVNHGNVTVGRNLTANIFGGNQYAVRYRKCHRLKVEPVTFCAGHDFEIEFGRVQVVEIIKRVNEARDEWARIFRGEFSGLPVPKLAFQKLVTEALYARGAFGTPEGEDPSTQRDGLFDACGGPDPDEEPLEIAPSDGKKEPYDVENDKNDEEATPVTSKAVPPVAGEATSPPPPSVDDEDRYYARRREKLIRCGMITPRSDRVDSPPAKTGK